MAVFDPVSNFGYGTVSAAPSPALSGLTFSLQTGEGSLFPDPATDGDYNLTLYPPDTGPLLSNAEIWRITAKSGDDFTGTRAQEGTSAKSVAVGWQVAFAPTAKTMQDIFDAINAVPGTGDVVGPASAVDSRPALFDGTSGKLIKQAAAALGSAAFVATSAFDASGSAAAAQAAAEATAANANNLSSGTVPAGRMPALTGDVTTSAGAVATTIANDAVTYAKMQNVSAASRLLGRGSSGGSGDVEEITLGSGLTMSGTSLSATGGGGGSAINVLDYGAIADGRFIDDFATTNGDNTVTSATAAFTGGDVGKHIGITGAGSSGLPLTTTIASINSGTSVEVTVAPSATLSGARGIVGTDNTTAFQDTIDAVDALGGGMILVPKGVYFIDGSFVSNPTGFKPGFVNSQLVLPARDLAADSEYNFTFYGEDDIAPNINWFPGDAQPLSQGGSIICSMKAGTGGDWSIFASGPPTGASWDLSGIRANFKNLTFRTYDNPKITPLNLAYVGQVTIQGCLIDTNTLIDEVSEPTNGGLGIILPSTNNWVISQCYDTDVAGYAIGLRWSEHTNINETRIWSCGVALQATDTHHGSWIGKAEVTACTKTIQFADIYGTGNPHRINIGVLEVEHETIFSDWRDWTVDLDDTNNLARGILNYAAVLGGVGAHDDFIFNGGEFIKIVNLNAVGKTQYTALTDGATITYDLPLGLEFYRARVTLGGNRTLAFTNARAGQQGEIIVEQDATGGRTLTPPGGSFVINGGAGVIGLSSAANKLDILRWHYDGSNFYFEPRLNFTAASGAPFDPNDYGTVLAWFKADAITGLSDGDPVSSWLDSDGGAAATQASGGLQPTYQTNEQNSLPVVRFDGGDVLSCSRASQAQPFTAFAVYKVLGAPAANQNVFCLVDGGNNATIYDSIAGNAGIYAGTTLEETTVITGWKVSCGFFNGGSSTVQANSNSPTSGAAGSFFLGTGILIGAYDSIPNGAITGDIGEIIFYSGTCSDIPAVISALRSKWAI